MMNNTATAPNLNHAITTIREQISFYEVEVERHPLASMISQNKLSTNGEKAFALYLFMDSWMWPSMLISMRDHAKHPKLKHAIEDNLQDEAGKRGVSHIKLCIDFVKSIGFVPALVNSAELNRTINVASELSEAQMAGWLAAAEMLTLPLYKLAIDCFSVKPKVDLRYLKVHMKVDEDHIQWLWNACEAIISENAHAKNEVLEGVALGARATLKSLDEIYEEALTEMIHFQH